jgi:benzoyl-CoA reductase/2-hydroxyglutaryl-CoA dehydratase subunit BcrC/BadD/HgdB
VSEATSIVYASPFVPPEWIAAHGLRPSRLRPGAASRAPAGACPFSQGFAEAAGDAIERGDAAGVVATTTCDQMRRVSEAIPADGDAVFLLNVPHTWRSANAHRTYVEELERLGRFLLRRGGREPDALVETLRAYDEGRRALLARRDSIDSRAFAELLARWQERGEPEPPDVPEVRPAPAATRVAVVGGPLRDADLVLYDMLEAGGGRVVLDATTTGERGLPAPFDRRRLATEPLLTLADAYFGTIPDAFRRPNERLFTWLREEIAARDVQAVVLVHCVWCDLWHAEVNRLREWVGVPATRVVLADADGLRRAETRVAALLEVVREGSEL